MSVRISKAVWDDVTLGGTRKLVLLAVADRANDDGIAWPAVDDIAQRCGICRRAVQKHLKWLLDPTKCGALRIVRAGGGLRTAKIATDEPAGWPNTYLVAAGRDSAELAAIVEKANASAPLTVNRSARLDRQNGALPDTEPRTFEREPRTPGYRTALPSAHKPSGTVMEPSGTQCVPAGATAGKPASFALLADLREPAQTEIAERLPVLTAERADEFRSQAKRRARGGDYRPLFVTMLRDEAGDAERAAQDAAAHDENKIRLRAFRDMPLDERRERVGAQRGDYPPPPQTIADEWIAAALSLPPSPAHAVATCAAGNG